MKKNNAKSIKGAALKKLGYDNAVQALPGYVKAEIDSLLIQRTPPVQILRLLSQKYPNQPLPSKSALYNYRNKYFPSSLTSKNQVARQTELIDMEKLELTNVLLDHFKRFAAFDLPTIRDKWLNNNGGHKTQKQATRAYLEAIKLCMEAVPRFNLTINAESTFKQYVYEAEKELEKETRSETLRKIVAKYGKQLQIVSNMDSTQPTILLK